MVEYGKYPFFTCAKEVYKINNYEFDSDALLISGNGSQLGYIHSYNGKFNAYQRTYVLENFQVSKSYINYFFQKHLKKQISKELSSGNIPYIKLDTISKMSGYFPSIVEQEKIADLLQKVDDLILVKQKEIQSLNLIRSKLLNNILKNTKTQRLEALCTKIGDGLHGTPKYDINGEHYFINGNNIEFNCITINENTKKISKLEFEKYNQKYSEGSIVISLNGSIGKVGFIDKTDYLLGKSIGYITSNYNNKKIFYILQTDRVQRFIKSETTGSTIKNLSLKTLKDIPIYDDNKYTNNAINLLENFDSLLKLNANELTIYENIKKSLLNKMLI